jgi:flavin-dependent dehydrogenase
MKEQFDVLIVGAGPAGSFAAERLAAGGASVALFDGRPQGEPKACGGGVTAKALKAWPHLLGAVGRTVNELELYSPSGRRLHLELDEPFAIYSRVAFDSYLRDRAQAAGTRVIAQKISARAVNRTKNIWSVRDASGAQWTTKFLVAADGANSGIAKKLAGPLAAADMEVAFGYRAPLPQKAVAPTVVAFLPRWVGYAWAFPRLDHISFGIATTQEAFDHKALDELMWQFMIGYYQQRETARQRSGPTLTAIRHGPLRRICDRRPNAMRPAFPAWLITPGTSDARQAKTGRYWVMQRALLIR